MSKQIFTPGDYPQVSHAPHDGIGNQINTSWSSQPQSGYPEVSSEVKYSTVQQLHPQNAIENSALLPNGEPRIPTSTWNPEPYPTNTVPPVSQHLINNWPTGATYTQGQNDPWNWNVDNNNDAVAPAQTWYSYPQQVSDANPPPFVQENASPSHLPYQQDQYQNVNSAEHSDTQKNWPYAAQGQPHNWNYPSQHHPQYSGNQWQGNEYNYWHGQMQPSSDVQNSAQGHFLDSSQTNSGEWMQWPSNVSEPLVEHNQSTQSKFPENSIVTSSVNSSQYICKNNLAVNSSSNSNLNENMDERGKSESRVNSSCNIVSKENIDQNEALNYSSYKSDSENTAYESSAGLAAFFNSDVQESVSSLDSAFSQTSYVDHCSSLKHEDNGVDRNSEVQNKTPVNFNESADEQKSITSESNHCENQVLQKHVGSGDELDNDMKLLNINSEQGNYAEEPVNQEVPEPSPLFESSHLQLGGMPTLKQEAWQIKGVEEQTFDEASEPCNQQIPEPSSNIVPHPGEISPSQERIIIKAREGSPFKPLSKSSSIRGIVMQQEISPDEPPLLNSDAISQEVNLESVPDNLERPPDPETQYLQQQQQLYQQHPSWHSALHKHHVRDQFNSSPSTTLWDSPDIPNITLAPAAPPFPPSPTHKFEKTVEKAAEAKPLEKDHSSIPRQSPIGGDSTQPVVVPTPNISVQPRASLCKNQRKSSLNSLPLSNAPQSYDSATEIVQDTERTSKSNTTDSIVDAHLETELKKTSEEETSKHMDTIRHPRNESREQVAPYSPLKETVIRNKDSFENRNRDSNFYRNDASQQQNSRSSYDNHRPRNENPNSSSRQELLSSRERLNPADPNSSHAYSDRGEYSRDYWDWKHGARQQFEDRKYASFDERNYYSLERNRSRPSSRTSLNEEMRDHYYKEGDQRYGYSERERTPSRISEGERSGRHQDNEHYGRYDREGDKYNSQYRRDDYYNRSRYYRSYEYDAYRSQQQYYQYYDPYRYGYNSYNYGFYDELYRNDPRYRQQVDEQYRQYYSQTRNDVDYERLNVHSGRSSVNEDLRKDNHSRCSKDLDQSSMSGSDYLGYNQYSSYGDPNSSYLGPSDQTVQSVTAERLTPNKFTSPHPIARFSHTGLLIKLVPRDLVSLPAAVEVHNMQQILASEKDQEELKKFPGPLTRDRSHKRDVIQFCFHKREIIKNNSDLNDRESYILLWDLMILLLRQNGSVAGSDIAELLLKNHEPLNQTSRHLAETPQSEGLSSELNESLGQTAFSDTPSPDEGIVVSQDRSLINAHVLPNVDKVTEKFREFLLFGNKKDALDWAMKNSLWGHALFLSSKMDPRTYASIMTRFANSLTLNDPLQTLYQLMSGRQPASVTCVADEKWGNWRPHLAMILSNPSPCPEVDARSITTLGDTLAGRGCLMAAHFCYLMAQVEFGSYYRKSSKLVLLGANHLLPFDEFATNETIQCSEIYEYTQTLANPGYILPHLQIYKFIYATRLAEYGFVQEALHYCEIISSVLMKLPSSFSVDLVSQVYQLANKLKLNDPHFIQGIGEPEDLGDPEWLSCLYNHLAAWSEGHIGSSTLSSDHAGDGLAPTYSTEEVDASHYSAAGTAVSQIQEESESYMNQQYQQANYQSYSWATQDAGNVEIQNSQNQDISNVGAHTYGGQQVNANYWEMNTEEKAPEFTGNSIQEEMPTPTNTNSPTSTFDYYGYSMQQSHADKQSRERQDSTSSTGFQRERRDSILSNSSSQATSYRPNSSSVSNAPSPTKKLSDDSKRVEKREEKPKPNVSHSWLGGIFNRFLPRAPNQMILPDDKNPTIVWDPSKNRWINTDEDEDEDTSNLGAPPTDVELLNNSSVDNSASSSSVPSPPPPSGANRFQRPKVRGMRQNYVDVLNPGGTKSNAPMSAPLFPSMEPVSTLPANLLVPSNNTEEKALDSLPGEEPSIKIPQNEADDTLNGGQGVSQIPLMFDPAEFATNKGSIQNQRNTSLRSRRTYPT